MDLRDSPADATFRDQVRAWLADEVPRYGSPPAPDDWPARRAYDTGWQRRLFDAGYAGLAWPAEYGGQGLPVSQQLVFLEEYARAQAPYVGVNFVGTMHAGPTLIAEGSDEQRRFHLPRILRGESVWCQGFSEPQAGSDLASLRTRAVRHGDEYVVSGQKIWSTRAQVADFAELLVRTDPDASKHRGITWLILDMHQPGVDVRPMRTIDGESHFCEVFLDEARVPVTNRVGAENDGWRVANVTLRFERGTAFAQHIVTLRTQLRRLVDRAKQGNRWDDTGLRRQVGRIDANVEALWRLTQQCVGEADATGLPSPLGSAVKLRYSELAQEIAALALRLSGRRVLGAGPRGPADRTFVQPESPEFGGRAPAQQRGLEAAQHGGSASPDVSAEPPRPGVPLDDLTAEIVRDYLWSFQTTIAAGTSQIQRNLIAERILGMPKGR